jgi:hypothetical protein
MRKWQGFVESRLRTFVGDLARLPFSRVRPWPKGIAVLPLLELPAPAVLAIPTPSASHAAAAAAAQAEDGAAEREVDEAVETTATLTKKKVKELQSMLAAEGLEKKGKKSVLVARLLEAQAVAAAKRIAAAAAASAVTKGEATSNVEEAGGANGAEAEAEKEKKTEVEEDGEDDVDSGNEGTAARERVSLKYIYLIGVEIDKQRLGKKPLNLSTKAAVWTNQILNHKLRSTDEDPELMLLSCQQVHFKNLSPIVMDEFGGAAVVNAARDARRRAKALAKRLKKEELVRLAREQLLQREVEAAEGEAGALKRAREEGSVGSSLTSSLAAGLSSLTRPLKREKWKCVAHPSLPLSPRTLSIFSRSLARSVKSPPRALTIPNLLSSLCPHLVLSRTRVRVRSTSCCAPHHTSRAATMPWGPTAMVLAICSGQQMERLNSIPRTTRRCIGPRTCSDGGRGSRKQGLIRRRIADSQRASGKLSPPRRASLGRGGSRRGKSSSLFSRTKLSSVRLSMYSTTRTSTSSFNTRLLSLAPL